MADLPDELHATVQCLCAEGDDFADAEEWVHAFSRYHAAFDLLPEPRLQWSAALWILGALGDVQFQRGDYAAGRAVLMSAMTAFDEACGNPFLRLRLGQCLYELGEEHEAANWLTGAFLTEGVELFGDEDPKYLTLAKSRLQTPPGGWPVGW